MASCLAPENMAKSAAALIDDGGATGIDMDPFDW